MIKLTGPMKKIGSYVEIALNHIPKHIPYAEKWANAGAAVVNPAKTAHITVNGKHFDNVVSVESLGGANSRLVQVFGNKEIRTSSYNLNHTNSAGTRNVNHGDPISMVTGEELLSLTDGSLPGRFPFAWQRHYISSAAEQQSGLGYGWSHGLNYSLRFADGQVYCTDSQRLTTCFPEPKGDEPFILNIVTGAALYLGEETDLYRLVQADVPGVYHFRRQGNVGRLIAITDRYDNRLILSYGAQGMLHSLDADYGRLLFIYHADSKLIARVELQAANPQAETPEQRWLTQQTLARYQYNEAGQLIAVTNALEEGERYHYRQDNVILQRTLAGGAEFHWEWEGEGKSARCLRQYGNFGQLDSRYQWQDETHLVTVTNIDGSQLVYQHDSDARLVYEKDADGAEIYQEFNERGLLSLRKDALGNSTHYDYDELGHLMMQINPDGTQLEYQYLFGNLHRLRHGALGSQEELVWRYKYNDRGDIISETGPDEATTNYSYNALGQVTNIKAADGSEQQLEWDSLGRLLSEQSTAGLRRYRYQGLHTQPVQVEDNGRITHYQWDALGRLLQITHPDGNMRRYRYNAYGKIASLINETGHITLYEYAAPLHLLTKKVLPDGSALHYRYDNPHLQVSSIENAHGEVYRLRYTPGGKLCEEIGFDNNKTTYSYDLNGHLVEKQEFGNDHQAEPLVTRYQRDPLGRLLVKQLPDGQEERYRYDPLGRLKEVNDDLCPLFWEYDDAGRLLVEHQHWASIRHRYDAQSGQLSATRLPDGQWFEHHYQDGRLQALSLDGQPLTAYDYDNCGREYQCRQGNGLINQYQYDAMGRLSQHRLSESAISPEMPLLRRQQDYQYQADGELSRIAGHDARQYRYSAVGALSAVNYPGRQQTDSDRHSQITETYRWDRTGNPITDPAQHQASGNRLSFYADRHFEYDRFGNLVVERRGKEQRLVTHYEYDCRHRLSKVVKADGTLISYSYDAFNRRVSKTVGGKTTEFIWQGNKLVAETDNHRHWRSFLYEPGGFRPLAMINGDASEGQARTYWYQNDRLGTPVQLTDNMGRVAWEGQYQAFGRLWERRQDTESRIDNPLRFQGQYQDDETELHYNLHRYYDPTVGRYLTQDPVRLEGGLNAYGYVDGNPVGWVDPLGLKGMPGSEKHLTGDHKPESTAYSWNKYSEIPKLPGAKSGEYNYRGVYRGHPDADNAIQGKVKPGNVDSHISAEDHNLGGVTGDSPYTSWSADPEIARDFAGSDGIILRVKTGAPGPGDTWSWEYSIDRYMEYELLLKGARSGAEVFKP